MSRATARRMLLTLVERGYAYTDGRTFELTPRVLSLGHGYWSGRSWHELLPAVPEGRLGPAQRIVLGCDTDR